MKWKKKWRIKTTSVVWPNSRLESLPWLHSLQIPISHMEEEVSEQRKTQTCYFHRFSLLFVCLVFFACLLALNLCRFSGIPPSQHPQHPNTAQSYFPPHLPLVLSPLFYLYVLPVSISISSSRGTGPALWLIIEIPPWGTVCLTPG